MPTTVADELPLETKRPPVVGSTATGTGVWPSTEDVPARRGT